MGGFRFSFRFPLLIEAGSTACFVVFPGTTTGALECFLGRLLRDDG
jgi:hypothetical protein